MPTPRTLLHPKALSLPGHDAMAPQAYQLGRKEDFTYQSIDASMTWCVVIQVTPKLSSLYLLSPLAYKDDDAHYECSPNL